MTTLVPRLWSDVTEWFEQDLIPRGGMIRLEDGLTDTEYTVRAELPGLDPEKDVQVNVGHGLLTIHAERKEEKQTKQRTEFRYGVFERSVRLPANAEENKVKAHYSMRWDRGHGPADYEGVRSWRRFASGSTPTGARRSLASTTTAPSAETRIGLRSSSATSGMSSASRPSRSSRSSTASVFTGALPR
jgi:HSP20 family protein